MSAKVLDNIKRTTRATIEGYNKWDIEAILEPRAENCTYQMRPLTLKSAAQNNDEYRQYYSTTVIPLFQNFKVNVESEVFDAEARKSVTHCHCTADSSVAPYAMEVVLMMSFNESGDKVVKMDEMMDSAAFASYLAKIEDYVKGPNV